MPGHVFVVHSLMEGVQYDVAVVPTSAQFGVRAYWGKVLNVTDWTKTDHLAVDHLRPADWPRKGFGRVPPGQAPGPSKPTWFLDVAVPTPEILMANLRGVLEDIAESEDVLAGEGRLHPLIALNTIGVGGGGFDDVRGMVIDAMFRTCYEFVHFHDLDLVICCSSASDYAAFQHQRRHQKIFPNLDWELQNHGQRLADLARRGELALFLGAGVSMPAGLPSWWDLLLRLGDRFGVTESDLNSLASPLDQAELINRRLADRGADLTTAVREELEGVTVPSLSHVQLAALGCREVVTTNFDLLYETAADAFAIGDDRIKVLPFEQKKPFQRWILKMHGDIQHSGSLVLSRSDFVGYSAAHGPVGSIVQSLMLTKHLLVVGTSLTDDNFLRLAYEITNYLNRNAATKSPEAEPLGTVLELKTEEPRRELWKGTFLLLGASGLPEANTEGLSDEEAARKRRDASNARARDLSIMLDFIAMHAAPESYLLDERYDALLDDREREVAKVARQGLLQIRPLAEAAGDGSGWRRLIELLRELGA